MQTLKESILKSVKAGKYSIENIKKWMEDFIVNNKYKPDYQINKNGKIETKNYKNLYIAIKDKCDEIPDFIEFGDISGDFGIDAIINTMNSKQLPDSCGNFILMQVEELKNKIHVKLKDRFTTYTPALTRNISLSKGIKDLTIEFISDNDRSCVGLEYSQVHLDVLKNITIIGKCNYLSLEDTPASNELNNKVRKRDKKNTSVDDVIRKYIPSCDKFKYIYTSGTTYVRDSNTNTYKIA